MGRSHHYSVCQEALPSMTEDDIERQNEKMQLGQMRKQYIKEKVMKT